MSGRRPSEWNRYRSGLAAASFLVACVGVAPTTAAQSTMDVLHAFGAPAQPATPSYGRLLEMPGGTLYGTTTAGAGAIYKLTPDGLGGFTLSVLHAFNGADGSQPQGSLINGGDGYLYGTTQEGGGMDAGTVYRIDLAGHHTILHSFNFTDGAYPFAGLFDGGDGFLYGTTANGNGTVFRLSRTGASFTTLHSFRSEDGAYPYGELVRGNDGYLYGTTFTGYGTGNSYGIIYRLLPGGTGFARLYSFTSDTGSNPYGSLVKASDGTLYGTTLQNGAGNRGTVYRFDPAGNSFTLLGSLSAAVGDGPRCGLALGADGWLYGTARDGGLLWGGTVFKIDPSTTEGFVMLRSFDGAVDGAEPLSALTLASDGFFYGTTSTEGPLPVGGGTVFRFRGDGTDFRVVASFDAATIEGAGPKTGLLRGDDGFFYGTTAAGGAWGHGSVFRMAPDGSGLTTLHSFDERPDGSEPNALLFRPSDGLLYGTTLFGGANWKGTIFRMNTSGTLFEVLHSFVGAEGTNPWGGLVIGPDDLLYGTTRGDWSSPGTLFRLNPSGGPAELVHTFPSGSEPRGRLLRVGSSLYGTTRSGGDPNYAGTLFRLDLPTTLPSTLMPLHTFTGSDGRYPVGGLVEGSNGFLYGTTSEGGSGGAGTVFRFDRTSGTVATLYGFGGHDGRSPDGPLFVGDSGYLYGTTSKGGDLDAGTAFAVSPDGADFYPVIYRFDAHDGRGYEPGGPLLQTSDGRLYGTASRTGATGGGTVFRLSPPAHVVPRAPTYLCRDQIGPTLTATAAGTVRAYQWGYRTTSSLVTNFVGQTSPSYTVNGVDFSSLSDYTIASVICTVTYTNGLGESVSNPAPVQILPACGGGSLVPPQVQVFTASTVNGSTSTTLHWVNPAIVIDEIVIRYRTDGTYPASADDTNAQLLCGLGAPSCGTVAAGAVGTFPHPSQTPGSTYSYAAFTRRGASDSAGKFASATPFSGPPKAAWAYSTGATSVVPPGLRPTSGGTPGAVYTVSNDRGLHAMTLGSTGGDWPAGWKPLLMNAPSQGRPIPVSFPTFTVNGVGKVVYVTSQDGRVYVADALTGALLRASDQICQGIQHSPGAMLRDFGGAYDVLIVGSRNTTTGNPATNTLFGLNPDSLAVRWTFNNGAGTNGIGIISGQPLVDYATNRVYFTSRQLAGGSSSTVWCLSFNETSATKVWEANVGSVDASVTLSNGTLYVGNLDGNVHALNAADGTRKWTAPFVTGDGPVKSLVWSAGTGNRLFFSTTRKTWAITDNGPGTAPTAFWTLPQVITSPSNPLVLSGRAFVGTGTGHLLQFDVTTPTPPAPVGVALTPHPEQLGRPTMDTANGVIYVGTDEGTIHAATYPF